uniref:Uncharacterized protein n=1 Tax=Mus spicilegus TaxID=10103 RepID=A0A8C6IKU6_MUSSI
MLFSGGQYSPVGRPEEVLLIYKIFLVIICFHVILVTSLKGKHSPCFLSAAESSLVSLIPYSNAQLLSCLTSWVSFLSGVKSQRNICNLSSLCNDSVFFRGEIVFQHDEDHNVTQNQDIANGTFAGVLSRSELNTVNCTFTVKLNETMNVCAMMVTFQTVQIRPMEQCCCSPRTPCPSSPEELEKLQCELQDPIVCLADQPHGPPLSSSSKPVPVVPQATIISHVASDFSLAEPLDHALMTPSTPSLTQESNLPSPQPTIPLASSPATDLPVQSVVVSSLPQTDLSHTLSPVQSSIPSPTTPAPSFPTELVTISTPPGETVVNTSTVSDLEAQVSQMEKALSLGSLEPNLAGEMVNRVSKLLHSPPALLAPLAQRLLKVVDAIGLQLNFSSTTISLTSPSLALAVIRVNASNFNTTTFAAQDPANLQVSLETPPPENSIGAITLPSSLMNNLPANDVELASRIQFNFFETPALFQVKLLLIDLGSFPGEPHSDKLCHIIKCHKHDHQELDKKRDSRTETHQPKSGEEISVCLYGLCW